MKAVQKDENNASSNVFDIVFVIGNCQSGTLCTASIRDYHSEPKMNLKRRPSTRFWHKAFQDSHE